MKYGIFGGSFDPPHLAHIDVAQAVKESLGLDEMVFVPANRNPLKARSEAAPAHRLEMTRLAISDLPWASVSDIEVTRSGRSYAVETMEELQMVLSGDFWFVLGGDALVTLPRWKSVEKLAKLCRFAAVGRPGAELDKALGSLPDWLKERVDTVEMEPHRASSTTIREEIELGRSPERWLDPEIWSYIQTHGLYQTT